MNESKEEIRRTGKRPRVAYREALTNVNERFSEEAEGIENAIGHFGKSRSSFYRAYNKKFPIIPTLTDLQQNEGCPHVRIPGSFSRSDCQGMPVPFLSSGAPERRAERVGESVQADAPLRWSTVHRRAQMGAKTDRVVTVSSQVPSGSLEWLPDQSTFDWGPLGRW